MASWCLIVAYIDTNNVVTRSLEALVQVGAAEAGIPQVLLAAVELMASSCGSDNELAQASRSAHFFLMFSKLVIQSIWESVFFFG